MSEEDPKPTEVLNEQAEDPNEIEEGSVQNNEEGQAKDDPKSKAKRSKLDFEPEPFELKNKTEEK